MSTVAGVAAADLADGAAPDVGPGRRRKWWPLRRKLRRAGPPVPLMAGYAGRPNWWKRHRRMLYTMLAVFAFFYGAAYSLFGTYILMQLSVPLVTLAALVVWLLPDGGNAPTALLGKLLFAFLIALLIWPDYIALALPGMPWVTARRLTAAPLALVMLISLSVSATFRTEMKAALAAVPLLWRAVVAFAVLALVSIAVSKDPAFSVSKYVVTQLNWTLIFFACAYCMVKPGRGMLLCYILWGCALLVCLIAVQEVRHQVLPWAGHIPGFLKVDDDTLNGVLSSKARRATGMYRARSVSTTPLGLAEMLALMTPFVVHIVFTSRRMLVLALALATIPLIFYIIVQTDSRLGMVGFMMTLMLYLLAWGALRWANDRESFVGPIVVMSYPAIFSAFIAATFFVRRLHVMVWGGGATQASSDARRGQIAEGIPLVLTHPWGYGVGMAARALGWLGGGGVLTIDTYYLSVALEYGVLGFLLYYGMFTFGIMTAGRYALKARDIETGLLTPIAIALANFVIVKSVFAQDANHPLVFAMLGMIVALVYRIRQQGQPLAGAASTAPSLVVSSGLRADGALPYRAGR